MKRNFRLFQLILFLTLIFPLGCTKTTAPSAEPEEDEFVTIELDAPKTADLADSSLETWPDDEPESGAETASKSTPTPTLALAPEPTPKAKPQTAAKPTHKAPKNVILMIADGAGFGAFYSAADFQTGSPTGLFYQQAPWEMTSVATFHKKSFYDPKRDWADFKNYFVPFYQREAEFIPPDSASTGTTLNTGVKTRNGRIGMGPDDEKLTTLAEIFHQDGRRTGAVTSFQIASATVAAVAGHDLERKNGQKLFAQLLLDGNLDVLIGASHPEFDDDGKPRSPEFGKYGPGEELWAQIRSGDLPAGWLFIEKRADFQKFAALTPDVIHAGELPEHLLGIAQSANSFQCHRSAGAPFLTTTPSLPEASLAALNLLAVDPKTGKRSKGFYVMIEGGCVDVANDAHDLTRCVEEMVDFNEAIEAVCAWVEKYSSWDETLLIITADHDNGAIYGPETGPDGVPTTPPLYRGKGQLPEMKYYSDDHTKQLVPLYARGLGSDRFREFVVGTDERMGKFWLYDGRYVDNTSVFKVIRGISAQ